MHHSSYFLTNFLSHTYPLLTFSCYMQNASGKRQYTKPGQHHLPRYPS